MHDSILPLRTRHICMALMSITKKPISAHDMPRHHEHQRPAWPRVHRHHAGVLECGAKRPVKTLQSAGAAVRYSVMRPKYEVADVLRAHWPQGAGLHRRRAFGLCGVLQKGRICAIGELRPLSPADGRASTRTTGRDQRRVGNPWFCFRGEAGVWQRFAHMACGGLPKISLSFQDNLDPKTKSRI